MNDQGVPLRLRVSLSPPLAAAGEAHAEAVSGRIAADVAELLRDLGLGRTLSVELETNGDETGVPIGVFVDERRCRFPESIVAEALAYVEGTPHVAEGSDALIERLRGLGGAGPEAVAELAATVCVDAISDQPAILAVATDDANVRAALGLGMHVAPEPDQADSGGSDRGDPVERFLAAAAGETLDVDVDPASLPSLTTELARGDLLQFLRDGLFAELGLPLPPFHVRPDGSLRPGGFAFRINAVRSPARIGLEPGTILVNDTAERLSLLNVAAQPTLNPATAQPASIVDAKHDGALQEAGLTTWTPAGFLILCFAAAVRRRAYALMTRDVAANLTQQLGWAFPVLNDAAMRHLGTDRIAQMLRELLRDGVSIHNLRRIEELMLRYDTGDANGRGRDPLGFVRAGLADLIAHTVSRGTRTAVVYLLDQDLERALADGAEPGQADGDLVAERVSAALRAELAFLPPTATNPALLTRDELRRRLAEYVRYEFPRTTVLSYADLPPDVNVQPVARIGSE